VVAAPSSKEAREREGLAGATRRWGHIVAVCCMLSMFYGFMPCSIHLQSTALFLGDVHLGALQLRCNLLKPL
jgi:hypothetical protein